MELTMYSEPSNIVFAAPTANKNPSFEPASPLPNENSMFSDSGENLTTPGEFVCCCRQYKCRNDETEN